MLRDRTLIICATVIVVVIVAGVVVLSALHDTKELTAVASLIGSGATGLVVLLGLRPKVAQAASNAADFTPDQQAEIEAIVIRALADFSNGKRP